MATQTWQPEHPYGQPSAWQPQYGTGNGRWIEYEDAEQRDVEFDERRAAYEREAERRELVDRERRRREELERAQKEREERAARGTPETERRPRTGIEHSVRRESTGTLIRDLLAEAQHLFHQELRLARAEMRHEMRSAAKGASSVGIGGAIAFVGLLALTACVIALLALALPLWASALIVGGLMALVGAMIAMGGMARLKTLNPKPERTAATLKEDREWASGTMRDVKSRRRAHA